MKRISSVTVLISVLTAVSLLFSGCNHESSQENKSINTTGNVTGVIYVDYARSYENLGELADDADLIAIGTIDRTETVPDEATMDKVDPRARLWNTRSVFRVEKSIKGDFSDEIIIIQTGAVGWAEEPGNPVFEPGERCFLFLRGGEDGIYGLLHPDGRFRIEHDTVSSMNYVLPTGQARPPLDLTFWRIDLDEFISRVLEAIKSGFVIPDEDPVISMELWWTMGGRTNDLFIYKDGTVVNINEWGLRMRRPDRSATRAWQFGKISSENLSELLGYFDSIGFNELRPDSPEFTPSTGGIMSDLLMKVTVNNGDINNFLTTSGYAPPEKDTVAKKLPPPLDEIYTKLIKIADGETEEAYREDMPEREDIVFEYPDGDE